MKNKLSVLLALAFFFALHSPHSNAFAQGTAFTYQGRLNSGTNVATGRYDLTFALFNVVSGAGQVGSTVTNTATGVTNGLFAVTLDFGANFTGADRWLEIAVRTNGNLVFTTLAPRQKITPTPYAITAINLAGVVANNTVNSTNYATVGGGYGNSASGYSATVSGGSGNIGSDYVATVGGGVYNLSSASFATVGGGVQNTASGVAATVGGGANNLSSGNYATVGGGFQSTASGGNSTVGGGLLNTASALNSTVGGGVQNIASGVEAAVGGGALNTASGSSATVGGGGGNVSSGRYATVGGGIYNGAYASNSTVGGGYQNTATGSAATIGGGEGNSNNGVWATVGGGLGNIVTSTQATVGGGLGNSVTGNAATVGGGADNVSSSDYATVGGGASNVSSNSFATVPGGNRNTAGGQFSFAAGYNAKALHDGAFVWSDYDPGNSGPPAQSTGENQFVIRASGGLQLWTNTSLNFGTKVRQMINLWGTQYGIGVQSFTSYFRTDVGGGFAWYQGGTHNDNQTNNGGGTTLMTLDPSGLTVSNVKLITNPNGGIEIGPTSSSGTTPFIDFHYGSGVAQDYNVRLINDAHNQLHLFGNLVTSGTINGASDRNVKEHFSTVDPLAVLEKVSALPISEWNYKTDSETLRHIGPMAQDFYAAFNVGMDDKHISMVDADGVALAAIQGLNKRLADELRKRDTESAELKARLEKLERLVNKKSSEPK